MASGLSPPSNLRSPDGAEPRCRHRIVTKSLSSANIRPPDWGSRGCRMDLAPEDLHYRLDQLRLLATETNDPLAERLVRDLIVELEDRLASGPNSRATVAPSRAPFPAASGLWLPNDFAERGGQANPSQGHAGDPDDAGGMRRVATRAPWDEAGKLQRPYLMAYLRSSSAASTKTHRLDQYSLRNRCCYDGSSSRDLK